MSAIAREKMSVEQFEALARSGKRMELVHGEVVELAPAGEEHGKLHLRLGAHVVFFLDEHELGEVMGAETGYRIRHADGTESILAPDMAYLQNDRVKLRDPNTAYGSVIPDLIAEVLSPSDSFTEVDQKMNDWLTAGVRLAWLVDPRRKQVIIYRKDQPVRRLSVQDTLDGEDVLPGFTLPLSRLFKEP